MEKVKIIILFLWSLSGYAQIDDFKGVNFREADSIANHYKGEDLRNLPLLTHKLTATLPTEAAKFRAIYTWVSTNITNDFGGAAKNQRKRKKIINDDKALDEWNTLFKDKVFKKLLKDKKTVCTGYAYLVKELATIADIECRIIDGYGRTIDSNIGGPAFANHSWNAVKLNDKWYLCDATWSSGYINIPSYEFKQDYNQGYFLTRPELFVQNHYPLETKWLLLEQPPSLDSFLHAPLIYGEAFKHKIMPLMPNKMYFETVKQRKNKFALKIFKPFQLEDLRLEIVLGSTNKIIKVPKASINEHVLEFDYTFNGAGHYDFHIKVKDKVIATYLVKVKRK